MSAKRKASRSRKQLDSDEDLSDSSEYSGGEVSASQTDRPVRQRQKISKYKEDEYEETAEERRLLKQALKNSMKDVKRVEYVIPDAPVKHPTVQEFKDPMAYILSIRAECAQYGMCLIVPPTGWNPPFAIDVDSDKTLATRKQSVHTLQETNGGFEEGRKYTYRQFKAVADTFQSNWYNEHYPVGLDPPYELLEKDYWDMVETGMPHATVEYGNDIDSYTFGSGFPRGYARKQYILDAQGLKDMNEQLGVVGRNDMSDEEYYKCTGWNLQNIALAQGSLLQYQTEPVTGVNSPWLYVGMLFASFCWHTEDNYLYSINYSHVGAPKQWYSIPGYAASDFDKAVKESHWEAFNQDPNFLYDISTQFSPSFLKSRGVPVYRIIQRPGSFVVTFPRAYHGGFNYGFNCNEATNFATYDWLPIGRASINKYRTANRGSPFSLLRLFFTLIRNFNNIKKIEDKITLIEVTISVLEEEVKERRGLLTAGVHTVDTVIPKSDFSFMKKEGMDYDDRRTCFHCKYVCVLSAVICQCEKDKVGCPLHYKLMCRCPNTEKGVLAWFSDANIQDLLRRLRDDMRRCVAESETKPDSIVGDSSSSSGSARGAPAGGPYAAPLADIF